jgi:Na+/H+ antiporter NhaC
MEAENLKFRGGWGMAFIPLAVFFIFCVLLFLVFLSYDMHALAMGGFIGLLIGGMFVKNYGEYWKSVISGIASPNSITIVVILFVIGMFSQMMKDSNASEGFIWIASRVHLTGGPFVAFVFFSCCLISTATGSSIGTMFAAFPVFFGAGAVLGANPAMLAGAITSGCIFGDNLAPISDTTIASASTQLFRNGEAADIAGVVTSRFKYSLVAGLISIILFAILGGGGEVASDVESMGDPLRLVSGLISGIFTFPSLFSSSGELGNSVTGFLPTGVASMMSTVTLVISVFGIMGVLHAAGAIDRLVNAILKSRFVKSDRGTELAITIGSCVTCMIFGGVTSAAILTFGPVVNELGMKKGLHPYRRANLLDGFVNTIPVVIPFLSVFVFITVALSGLDPLSESKSMLYPLVLFVVLLFSVITGWGRMHEIQVAEIS